jgi:acyl-coenzyme A thioesterase PaaI-like protein
MHQSSLMDIISERLGERVDEFLIPPPVFEAMRGEIIDIDLDVGTLTTRFPVLETYQNPYRSMQGGMVAAVVDNTLGPLSMLVAPPNVTRRLDMKYSRPIMMDLEFITVKGQYVSSEGRNLMLKAEVRGPENQLLARARATHWIIEEGR